MKYRGTIRYLKIVMHAECTVFYITGTLHFIIQGYIKRNISGSCSMKPNRPRECCTCLNFNILGKRRVNICRRICIKKTAKETYKLYLDYSSTKIKRKDSAINHLTWGNAKSKPLKFSFVHLYGTRSTSDCVCFFKQCGNSRPMSGESPGIKNLGLLIFIFMPCITGLERVNK